MLTSLDLSENPLSKLDALQLFGVVQASKVDLQTPRFRRSALFFEGKKIFSKQGYIFRFHVWELSFVHCS